MKRYEGLFILNTAAKEETLKDTIDKLSSEDHGGPCIDVNYDPMVLPTGIEPSDDPILSARSAAYSRSFTLREGERTEKPPSAVTPQEVQAGGKS